MEGESTEANELGTCTYTASLYSYTCQPSNFFFTELLERVFLRVGVTESDSQLEQVLARFLPPVLLKTASDRPAIKTKVST